MPSRPRCRALALALAALAVLAGGAAAAQDSIDAMRPVIAARYPSVRWVDAPTLERWMASARGLTLLDARQPAEFGVSHLRGATRIDPDHPDVDALRAPRSERTVVYCSVGWRSAIVADALQDAGFADVHNLEGGIFAWANAGRPVFRGAERVRAVHPYDDTWGRMLNSSLRTY